MKRFIKGFIKDLLGWFLYASKVLDVFLLIRHRLYGSQGTVILLYHRVIPRDRQDGVCSFPGIVVSRESFEKQMRFLSEHYNVMSLDDYLEARVKKIPLPYKTAVITFDDGWKDNFLYALPLLKRYKLPATIFLATGFIGKGEAFWPEKLGFLVKQIVASRSKTRKPVEDGFLEELRQLLDSAPNNLREEKIRLLLTRAMERLLYLDESRRNTLIARLESCLNDFEYPSEENSCMNWEQIEEMKRSKISFGSHGVSHNILTVLQEEKIAEELEGSKRLIEDRLGIEVKSFAYPNGDYSEDIVGRVRGAGYKVALTVDPGINTLKTDIFRLKRINIHEGVSTGFSGNFSKGLFSLYLSGLL